MVAIQENQTAIEGEVVGFEATGEDLVPASPLVLSAEREALLKECEQVIERGLMSFIEVGTALETILKRKLWAADYPSQEEYLRRRWAFKLGQAQALSRAARSAGVMQKYAIEVGEKKSAGADFFPENEKQMQPLVALREPEAKWRAWARAIEIAGNRQPTQVQVIAAVSEIRAQVRPDPPPPPTPAKTRGTITIGIPVVNAIAAIRTYYTYTEIRQIVRGLVVRDLLNENEKG